MGRIITWGTVGLIVSTLFVKAVQNLIIGGIALWLAGLGFPYLADAWGIEARTPAQAVGSAAESVATLTAKPPTPTLVPTATTEPAESAWPRVKSEIDGLWEKDWPATISVLKDFNTKYPNHGEARAKLYAALVSFADVLAANGRRQEAIAHLQEADTMIPGREAGPKLRALGGVPTQVAASPVAAQQNSRVLSTPTPVPAVGATADLNGRWLMAGGVDEVRIKEGGGVVEVSLVKEVLCTSMGERRFDDNWIEIKNDDGSYGPPKGPGIQLIFKGNRSGDLIVGETSWCNANQRKWQLTEAKVNINKEGNNLSMFFYAGATTGSRHYYKPRL